MAKKSSRKGSKSDGEQDPPVDFEAALADVEQVVERLESGELGLSESLAQYEKGIEKIKLCHRVLQQAENRISVLTSVEQDGTPQIEPVDTGTADEEDSDDDDAEADASDRTAGRARKSKSRRVSPPSNGVDEGEGLF